MNLVGKILIVLILVFSVVFMGFAVAVYSTHKSWERTVNRPATETKPGEPLGLKLQLDQLNAEKADLQAKLDKMKADVQTEEAARRQALARLETEKADLETEYTRLANDEAKLKEDLRQAVAAVQAAEKTLDARLQEIEGLRNDINTALTARDDFFDKSLKLTDDLHQAQVELTRVKDRSVRLAEQVAMAKTRLERLGGSLEMDISGTPPPVDGVVLASGGNGLVEISLGSDDGLQAGHLLEVFRHDASSSKYVGRIEVVRTSPDKSVAKVLPEFRKATIQKEDRVATRLN